MNRPRITVDHAIAMTLTKVDGWNEWLEENRIVDLRCVELCPLDESLTLWDAECLVSDEKGKLVWYPWLKEPETKTQRIRTTPARPEWLERGAAE